MRFLVCGLVVLLSMSGNVFGQLVGETIDRIEFETTVVGSSWNPDVGFFRIIEHPSEFLLSNDEDVTYIGTGFAIASSRQLLSVSESGGNIIYEFEPDFDRRLMFYAIDLVSTFPMQYSTSGRFRPAGPLELVAEPGSSVATMNGHVLILEYNRQDVFETGFDIVPFAAPFGSIVPFSIEFTLDSGTWQLDTFENAFDYNLLGHIDLASTSSVPDSISVFRGLTIQGDLAEVQQSDDAYLLLNPGFTINSSEAPVWVEFFGVAPGTTTIDVESQAGTPGLTYTVEAWNWNSGGYDEIGSQVEQFNSDQVVTFGMVADHVNSDGSVRSRVGWRRTGFVINFPWEVRIDHVVWN